MDLEQRNKLFECVLNSIGAGVIVADREGKFIIWNPAAEQMLGRGATNLGSAQWSEFYGLYADDGSTLLQEHELPMVRAIRGESIDRLRVYVNNASLPKGLWLNVNVRPLIDPDGNSLGGVIVFDDNSQQRLLERELLRSNQDLQEFASIAAHDLQEPLRTIGSFLELLYNRQKDTFDDKSRHYVKFIDAAVLRMQNLISDLLTYSRIQTRAKAFELVDCNELVEEALANLNASVSETGATINIERLPAVRADGAQLGQVFQNLIGNALKFRSTERPLIIDVRAEKKRAHWVFSVHDNGIGIHPDQAQRIFGLFQRLHTVDEYPGSGIGLSVCKRIVQRHNGVIFVESKPGIGSSFYFTIET